MKLSRLLEIVQPFDHKGTLNASSLLVGLAINSRDVEMDFVFMALPSARSGQAGGEAYVAQALAKGAKVIISPLPAPQDFPDHLCWLQVESPRVTLSKLAREFYPKQPKTIVAVTGTNGKSSIVDFTFQLWQLAQFDCARMGTIGVEDSFDNHYPGIAGLTTPDALVLHKTLESIANNGIDYLAMESSSHALDQHRMDGAHIQIASFTNLTHDHLDYHKNAETYFKAKARLFTEVLPQTGTAVLNVDDPASAELAKLLKDRHVRVVTYGSKNADIQYCIQSLHVEGQDIELSVFGRTYNFHFPLIGEFQISNAVCALANAILTGADEVQAVVGLAHLKSVPGRLQKVSGQIYVDYAHTPDALATALKALRPHTSGKLIVVFGCGGNRDPFKRPLMGQIAGELADVIYVTDDNPRHEDPRQIRKEVMAACPHAVEFESRQDAIHSAINALTPGDILLIAGKGHETGQIVGDEVQPFNDVNVAQQALLSV